MRPLKGIVFCGGQSSRMGCDKGLITENGLTWAEIARRKLSAWCGEVYISINPSQLEKYAAAFPLHELIIDDAEANRSCKGPLLGLLTTHKKYPGNDWMALACDMTDMQEKPLQLLWNARQQHRHYTCYAFAHEEIFEPLCAIYTPSVFRHEIPAGDKRDYFSMREILLQNNVCALTLTKGLAPFFKNYNELKD